MRLSLVDLSQQEIIGLTIYGEARGELVEGQIAVGCVIRNRMHLKPSKYKSYHEVCLEPKQFSCWNSDDKNYETLIQIANRLNKDESYIDSDVIGNHLFFNV